MHDTYSALRHFADSWGLLAMFVFFIGVIVWALRPGSRKAHHDAATVLFRNEDRPAAASARNDVSAPHRGAPANAASGGQD